MDSKAVKLSSFGVAANLDCAARRQHRSELNAVLYSVHKTRVAHLRHLLLPHVCAAGAYDKMPYADSAGFLRRLHNKLRKSAVLIA